MRSRKITGVSLRIATAAAWAAAVTGVFFDPMRPAVALLTGAGVTGFFLARDRRDRKLLIRAIVDTCAALRGKP